MVWVISWPCHQVSRVESTTKAQHGGSRWVDVTTQRHQSDGRLQLFGEQESSVQFQGRPSICLQYVHQRCRSLARSLYRRLDSCRSHWCSHQLAHGWFGRDFGRGSAVVQCHEASLEWLNFCPAVYTRPIHCPAMDDLASGFHALAPGGSVCMLLRLKTCQGWTYLWFV